MTSFDAERAVAIIGGTGAEGSGLALRFAKAGRHLYIGSRSKEKAEAAAREIAARAESQQVQGCTYEEAAASAAIVVLTVPVAAQMETLKRIKPKLRSGAIVVDSTVPLEVAIGGRVSRILMLWDGSAAQQAARVIGSSVTLVAGFHSLSAAALSDLDHPVDCDALICGDDDGAKRQVVELAELIPGVRAVDAGPLDHARYLESAAALLIALNLRQKVKHSGIRITGLPRAHSSDG